MNTTSLHDMHESLNARIVDFHGWLLPVQYEGVLAEHRRCRTAAALFDTGHMGQLLFSGPGTAAALGRICTQDPASLKTGRSRYGFLLNENAGIIDDTILMKTGDEEFLMVVNADTADGDREWIASHIPGDVSMTDLSAEGWGKIDLQGPLSYDILAPLTGEELAGMNYFGVCRTTCCERKCILGRTGYTGELGYEIMAPGEYLRELFSRLLEHEAVAPAGLGARDSLRLEMCYPLYGNELSTEHTPIEADLAIFLKGDGYIGAAAVRKEQDTPPPLQLVAMKAATRRRAGEGDTVLMKGQEVGYVTSAAFSPSLEFSIAMGYIQRAAAMPGTDLVVATGRGELPVRVCEKPLYGGGSCRTKLPQQDKE